MSSLINEFFLLTTSIVISPEVYNLLTTSIVISPEVCNLLTTSIVISLEVCNLLTTIVFDFSKERSFRKIVIF